MENEDNNNQQNINFDISPEVASGEYSNLVFIAHSPTDFVLDFARVLPGLQRPQVRSRVVLSPEHAKRLMLALRDNVVHYEAQFGNIDIHDQQPSTISPFGNGKGQA
jgi:hypothetical protein